MRADLIPTTFGGALGRLVEEAGEVIVECGHITRFGITARDAKTGLSYDNGAALKAELDDLTSAIREMRHFLGFDATDLAYLATPYSKYPSGIEAAFRDAAKLAARLMLAGVKVYSPIAHTHPLAVYGGIDPLNHAIWMPFDRAMMDACSVLIVAHMEGWEKSRGIEIEVDYFRKAGKPIFDLDPESLVMTRRNDLNTHAVPAAEGHGVEYRSQARKDAANSQTPRATGSNAEPARPDAVGDSGSRQGMHEGPIADGKRLPEIGPSTFKCEGS